MGIPEISPVARISTSSSFGITVVVDHLKTLNSSEQLGGSFERGVAAAGKNDRLKLACLAKKTTWMKKDNSNGLT